MGIPCISVDCRGNLLVMPREPFLVICEKVFLSTRGPIDFKVSAGGIKFLKYMVL